MENTYVWNSKVKYIRSGEEKFDNLKECLENNKYMYIGRRGIVFIKTETGKERFPKTDSVWANPYKVGKDGTLDEVLEKYEQYIKNKIINENLDLLELQNKILMCWCVESKVCYNKLDRCVCHGQVLLKLLNMKLKENSKEKEKDRDSELESGIERIKL